MRSEIVPEKDRKMSRREFLYTVGACGTAVGFGMVGFELWKDKQRKEAVADIVGGSTTGFNQTELDYLSEEIDQLPTTATPSPSPTPESVEPDPEPTPTPEKKRIAEGFVLAETIDLSDHTKPIIMAVELKNKKGWLVSSLASPYSYAIDNEKNRIFHPSKFSVETYIANENVLTTWMHAGTYLDKPSFTRELELFLRKPGGATSTPVEVEKNFREEIIGARVFVFQGENKQSFPRKVSDILINPRSFKGNILELVFSSGTRVPRWQVDRGGQLIREDGELVDAVEDLSEHVMDTYDWLAEQYPKSNFSRVSRDNLWGIKFCSTRLLNEIPLESENPMQYGRWVLGLSVPEKGVKKIDFRL